jgi:DDE superfamily endonuclease
VSSYGPRSSLSAKVLGWLCGRLAHLFPPRPPGRGGTRPLSLEVRLDAVAAVLLDGLSYRRAGRVVGVSKTEVGDSLDLLLGPLTDIGFCQSDGTFITSLADLGGWFGEMARCGEAVVVDGLATGVQRPSGWGNQMVLYDAKRHAHTAQGLALSTIHGDLLWCDGGWPGSCHEHELLGLSGLGEVLDATGVTTILDRGFRGLAKGREQWPRRSGTGGPRTGSPTSSGRSTTRRRGCGPWWSRRSAIWPTSGRCAAGAGCCTGSARSSGLLVRWCAWAAGCTASPHAESSSESLIRVVGGPGSAVGGRRGASR